MKVAILFDAGSDEWSPQDVAAVVGNVHEVRDVLRRRGHEVELLPVRLGDFRWLSRVRRADLVFNLCEGINGHARFEDLVVGTLELTGVPFTGCRHLAHHRLPPEARRQHPALGGRPSGPGLHPGPGQQDAGRVSRCPAIVKPAAEDASVGIDNGAVCTCKRALKKRVAQMLEQFEEVLVQEYVAGREFNVGFVGKRMLPIAEIRFDGMPDGHLAHRELRRQVDPGEPGGRGHHPGLPGRTRAGAGQADRPGGPDGLGAHVRAARATAGWISASSEDGQPYVLEVNPCPDLSSNAGLARMGRAFGWSYDDLVMQIVDEALTALAEPSRRRGPGQRGVRRVSGTLASAASPPPHRSRPRPHRGDHPCGGTLPRGRDPRRARGLRRAVAAAIRQTYIALGAELDGASRRLDLLGPDPLHPRHLRSLLDGGGSRRAGHGHRHRAPAGDGAPACRARPADRRGDRRAARLRGAPAPSTRRRGYSSRVSVIPDFYAPGDDQVVFVKDVSGKR